MQFWLKIQLLLTCSAWSFCLAAAAVAQEGSIAVDSKVDKSTITIGDLVTYSVIVSRSPEVQVEMPELGSNLGAFEIRDYQVYEPKTENGQVIERVDYTISTFDVGDFEIPPLTFSYTIPGDSTRHQIKTRKIEIVVESLKPSEAGDIRDIKKPLGLPRDYRQWILWGSIIFAFVILVSISIYIWRRKKAGKGLLPEKVEPPKPAHEIALNELAALRNADLLKEGRVKEYYIRISEIIRRYVEGRYFIVALELTTYELVENLKQANVESENIALIQEFLELCDLVKFAKYAPSDEQNEAIYDQAVEIVERTKLVYDQEETEEIEDKELPAAISSEEVIADKETVN